jgi:cation diffusion facilitator CzcD-associated flavoprotein CzcO
MTRTNPGSVSAPQSTQHFDVVIGGAGISGVGAAYHLTKQCAGTSFVVLEAKDSFGGSWITHRYPGIRSDSDLYTFGYRFKPWTGAPIATAAEILSYMGEVIDENDLRRHIRYRHEITSACWSSRENLWTIDTTRTDTDESLRFAGNFLWMCQGYYRHSHGCTPEWSGMADYRGQIVHPQNWPEDLDYAGKNIVVIGSGSTAATLIPAIAGECGHVTMLQRSPTYFRTGRNATARADELRELDIDEAWIHEIVRKKILHDQAVFTGRSFTEPEVVKHELLAGVRAYLGADYDMEAHFTPKYRPWRQRIAFIPDGDFLEAIRAGKASVVTDEIEKFRQTGILLRSGRTLDADIIGTATGFNLNVLGDIEFVIDGKPLVFSDTVTYRGMMFTGVPNMAWVFGYFRASWTLRADLVADLVCRLLNHMNEKGVRKVTPTLRPRIGTCRCCRGSIRRTSIPGI